MGQIAHSGTFTIPNSGLQDPNTGQLIDVGSPQQITNDVYQRGAVNNQTQHPTLPGDTTQNPAPLRSKVVTPSLGQSASAGATPGGTNALSPGLSKAGKLAVLLTSGLQGAIAGRAAQEQTSAETGGRRSGGFGTGFNAGYSLPWQRAQALGGLAQQQAQTQLLQSQSQIDPTTGLPMYLSRYVLPAQIRGQAQTGVAKIGAQSRVQSAEISHRFITVPNVGLFDTKAQQMIPGTQQGIVITPDIAKDYGLPDTFVGKPMTLSGFSSLENAQRFNEQPIEGQSDQYLVNRNPASPNFGQKTPLGVGIPALGRAVQIADPNSPGNTTYTTAGNAIRSGAAGTGSAALQVPRKAQEAAVPTNIGNQTVAFNTAIQHAQLLRQAAQALQNGNTRLLNSISNQAKSQFGDPNLTNFDAIANAYNHEVSSVIAKGHITDSEVKTGGATMPSNANYATIDKVLNSYLSLMQSKMKMLNQQTQAAVGASQPRGSATPAASGFNWNSFPKVQ